MATWDGGCTILCSETYSYFRMQFIPLMKCISLPYRLHFAVHFAYEMHLAFISSSFCSSSHLSNASRFQFNSRMPFILLMTQLPHNKFTFKQVGKTQKATQSHYRIRWLDNLQIIVSYRMFSNQDIGLFVPAGLRCEEVGCISLRGLYVMVHLS